MKTLKTTMLWSVTLLAVLLVASPALATKVTYTGVAPGETATINIVGFYNGGALAGIYNFKITDDAVFSGSYQGFCVDPAFSDPGPYEATIAAVLNNSKYEAAAYLLNKYFTQTPSNALAAKYQLAVWELVFDYGNGYDLASGKFIYTGGYTNDVSALVTEASGALSGFSPGGFYIAKAPATGENYGVRPQDFIFQKVSEPGILLLLGTGMLGLALVGRKTRRQRV